MMAASVRKRAVTKQQWNLTKEKQEKITESYKKLLEIRKKKTGQDVNAIVINNLRKEIADREEVRKKIPSIYNS